MIAKESRFVDQRTKLVTDMVAGIRTIKAYAWEHAYAEKVDRVRKQQLALAYRSNSCFLSALAFFMGGGCVLLIIYIGTLFASDEVDSSKSLSFFLLSMALNIQVRQFQSIFMGMDVNLRVK